MPGYQVITVLSTKVACVRLLKENSNCYFKIQPITNLDCFMLFNFNQTSGFFYRIVGVTYFGNQHRVIFFDFNYLLAVTSNGQKSKWPFKSQ